MAHPWQRQSANSSNDGGQNSGQSSGIADPLELAAEIRNELRHIGELAVSQNKRRRSFTTLHTTSVVAAGTIMPNLHLPEESAIAGAHIENHTIATLTVYEGSGSGGRVIGIVKPTHYKRIALADYISSISIVADIPDPSAALVFVTLSTHQWSPVDTALT